MNGEERMIKQLFRRPAIFWVLGVFVLYIFLAVFLSEFYVTVQYIPFFWDTLNWTALLFSVFLTLVLGLLVAMNTVSGYLFYKQKTETKKLTAASTVTGAGTLGGLATGVCPVCTAAVFPVLPFFSGIFSSTVSFASLPFQGREVQAILILMLGINLYFIQYLYTEKCIKNTETNNNER